MLNSIKSFFKLLYRYWMKFAHVLGWVNTRIILTVFYVVIFAPVGLLLRIFKKDLLEEGTQASNTNSYWLVKEPVPDKERYLKPY